jgi:antitoxin component YwqK of YwqJK toxin-antitoxin module
MENESQRPACDTVVSEMTATTRDLCANVSNEENHLKTDKPETRTYYRSGELETVTIPTDVSNINVLKTFYKSGIQKGEYHFKINKLHGPYKEFYENGQLLEEGTYRNSRVIGILRCFHENGNIRYETSYDNDRRISEIKRFDKNGNLISSKP